jgi:hypothetical protein
MNVKFAIIISWLVSFSYISSGVAIAENKVDDFFDKSLAELAEMPVVTIATGTPADFSIGCSNCVLPLNR